MLDQEHEGGMKVCSSVLGGVVGKGMPNEEEGENSSEESEDEDKDDDEDFVQEENEETEFHKTYCKKHKNIAVIVYVLFFAVNIHIAFTQSDNATISYYLVGILVTNEILILGILFSLFQTHVGWINKLSGLLNIALAVQLYILDQNNQYSFSHQYEILGLLIFGAHTILMLSSQFFYDFIGFIVCFIIHTSRLGSSDNIFPLVIMWCIISVATLQKYLHNYAIKELFFSRQRQQLLLDAIETVLPSAVFSLNKTNMRCFIKQPKLPQGNNKNTATTNRQNQTGSIDVSQRNIYSKVQVQQEQQFQSTKLHQNQQNFQQQQLPVSPNNLLKNYPSSLNPVSQNISAAATSPNNRNITSNALLVQKQPGQIVRSMAGFTEILQGSTSCAGNISYQLPGNDPLMQWTLNLSNNHSKQAYKITDMASFVNFANHVYVDARQFVEDVPKESMEQNIQPKSAAPSKEISTFPFHHQPKRQSPPSSHLGDSHFHGILAPPINLSRSNYLQNSQAIVNSNINNPNNTITTSNYNTNNNSILQANILNINQNKIPQNFQLPVPLTEVKIQNSIGFPTHNTNNNSNNIASTGIQNSVPGKSTMHQRNKESELTLRSKKGFIQQIFCCLKRNKKIKLKKIKSQKTEQEMTQQLNPFGNPLETGGHNQITLFAHLKSIFEKQNSNENKIKKKKKMFVWKFNGKYYPDIEEGQREALVGGEQDNASKKNNANGIAIQIRVCGFQGQNRLFFCVDDVSVSEKIQLYQAQDKFKDLVLANTAHDLRQPLNSLNYTITEAKKILLNLKVQSQIQRSNDQSAFADSVVGFVSESGIIEPKKNKLQEKQEFAANLDGPTSIECKFIPQSQDPTVSRRSASSTELAQNGDNYIEGSSESNEGSKNINRFEEKSLKVQEINMIIELLELAEISGNSLKYLINDILDHAKLREGKLQANFKECSLNSIFEFTKHIFNHQFKERGIIFKIFLDPKIEATWKICTDQQRLQQVLVNLLSNAMKFTQANKYVILHISRVSKSVNNRIISLLKIAVIDQGCGMSESQLNQIFAPFVSFNDNSMNIEGIGLGLHICKSIVGLLGPYPKLFVRSKLNEGSKFFFYIYHQLRKGSQAFKTPKPQQTPQEETANLQQSKQQLKSQPGAIHELQEVLDKKSIMSIIEDSQSSNDVNNAVFSETKMDSNERKLQKSGEKNKNKNTLAAEQFTGSNEQDIMSIEEEMKSPEKIQDETLDEEEEDEEGKGTELDIQSIILEVVGPEDFQEQSYRNQSHCHQMNKYWHIGKLPHTITSLNSHKSSQNQYYQKSQRQQLCISPCHSSENRSQNLIEINSNSNIIGFQHALAKEQQFQSHFVQSPKSPKSNQSTFFNQSIHHQQTKNFIHQSTKQLLPLLPLVTTSSSNAIGSSNSNKNIVNSPRGPSQSNLSLYSFGKKQSIQNTTNNILIQQQQQQSLQSQSPLLHSPSLQHSTQQSSYKNTLIRLSKPPKTKKKKNQNIPPILRQFSQKYPNALNEMEASTGSADVAIQEELSVLIADDDVFGISILKMMLKKSGLFTFDVKEVFNGKDSLLEFMKQNHPDSNKPYALVISDIRMPQMDGIESVKKMRQAIANEKYFQATFIGVSAIDQSSQNDTELSVFDIVLSKPLKEQALLNAINQNLLDFY